ncbi:uncharacterized protein LOC110465263 isoform X1 [Mizuhopecten yessoensis]|uniref:uncharacterized protein LOC110465263 isoform X1 n=1 Tax=Mizuhopecten yessoensis TaxID=6573 RepID=UPI000B45BF4B|nr:uncharacterized protein LOC110465263 isoform X1 [Mizuhopecten yessoensis]
MCGLRNSTILFLLVLFHMNLYGDTQLIGEEKKYVFLEQAVLERVKSTLLEMTNTLEERMGRLEEDNKQITSKLNSIDDPINSSTEPLVGCPASDKCTGLGLESQGGDNEAVPCRNRGIKHLFECPLSKSGPRFVMDPATLFLSFLSKDKLTLSNRRLESSHDWPAVNDRKYKGAQGSTVISSRQTMYFETDIYYRIERDLGERNLVFEVGFATEKAIGEGLYVGGKKGGWSIFAYNFTQGVTLCSQFKGEKFLTLKTLSDATYGTEKYLKLGFFINRVDRSIGVFDINMNRKIYTFTNVDGSQELWPVFGVYSTTKAIVRLRLNVERDIISVPCGLF